MFMVRLLFILVLFFALACSIIQESDIESLAELSKLKLKSIEIAEQTELGKDKIIVNVTDDLSINIQTTSGLLTRALWMKWPSLGNGKLKFKSGASTEVLTYTSFLESGKPYTFSIFNLDTVALESYLFRYDDGGRIAKIIYLEADEIISNDTLIYGTSGELSSVIRRSPISENVGTIALGFGTKNQIIWYDFQGAHFEKACQGNGCGPYYGGNYHTQPLTGNNTQPVGILDLTNLDYQSLTLHDKNKLSNNGCSGCRAWIDTFYFHPLMLLNNRLELGETLLFIYMIDWWEPVTNEESGNDERLTFTFKYEK